MDKAGSAFSTLPTSEMVMVMGEMWLRGEGTKHTELVWPPRAQEAYQRPRLTPELLLLLLAYLP